MNYYQFSIGDYRRDTTHLSMLEHGAYRQLLDWFYLEEKPIPRETETVYRRLSARTKEEQNAIQIVLGEMFELTDVGYIHTRCMREIAIYQAKADRAREAGKLGGRPKKTEEVISWLAKVTDEKANHKPLTINQEPKESKSLSGKPDASPKDLKNSALKKQATEILEALNEATSRSYQPVDANLKLIVARLKEGAEPEHCKRVIGLKCADWATDPKMSPYLRPATLFNKEKFWQYHGELYIAPKEAAHG